MPWPEPRAEPHVLCRLCGFRAALPRPDPPRPTGVGGPARSTQRPWAQGWAGRTGPLSLSGRRLLARETQCGLQTPLSWPRSTLETSPSSCVLGVGLKPVGSGSEAGPTTGLGQLCPQPGGREDSLAPQRARTPLFPWAGGGGHGAEAAATACSPVLHWAGPRSTACCPPGAAPTLRARSHCSARGAVGSGRCPGPHISAASVGAPVPTPTALAQVSETPPPPWPCFLAFQRAQATPRGPPTPPDVAGILRTTGGQCAPPVSLHMP